MFRDGFTPPPPEEGDDGTGFYALIAAFVLAVGFFGLLLSR